MSGQCLSTLYSRVSEQRQKNSSLSNPDICLLTEPSCSMSSHEIINSIPQGFSAFVPRTEKRTFKNDTGTWPRSAVLYRSSLKIWPIRQFQSRDCTVAQMVMNFRTIFIVSLYMDCSKMSFPEVFINLLEEKK